MSFDEKAKTWDQDPKKVERAHIIAQKIILNTNLKTNSSGFEYGCGTGLLSFALQPSLGKITLADSSQEMLNVLSEKIKANNISNMHPIKLDLEAEDFSAEKFDLIYTLMTMHHINDTKNIISKFYELLNPNGYLCISDLDKEDGSFHGESFTGHKGFNRNELQIIAQNIGFLKIEFSTVYVIKKEKEYPLFLMTARK